MVSRSPVTIIRGYASLLTEGDLQAAVQREAARKIEEEADVLIEVVESLLRNGSATAAEFDVGEAITTVLDRLGERITRERASVETVTRNGRTVRARGNAPSMCLVLTTLIANALTYSVAPARVVVEVRDLNPIEIAVRDHGVGIAEENREHLFALRAGPTIPGQGLGIGLALSRRVAQLHGGGLRLERSEVGEGSTFVLWLRRSEHP